MGTEADHTRSADKANVSVRGSAAENTLEEGVAFYGAIAEGDAACSTSRSHWNSKAGTNLVVSTSPSAEASA